MMPERQRNFRETYRSNISPLYSGLLHIGVLYGCGLAAIWYSVGKMAAPTWEWALVIPVFIAGNFAEWYMHRYIMHRRVDVFALRAIYERHTRQHHQYFSDTAPGIDTLREFRIVFFPWRVLITLGVGGIALGTVARYTLNANAGYVVFVAVLAQYLVYETFHLCCHVHDSWFVRNVPFINTIRRHHTAHHNMGIMMKFNMNLTFPIADWFFGTSDLNRGLFGHLFNGYNDTYVKNELKPIIARFRSDHSCVTFDGPQLTAEEERLMAGGGQWSASANR
jgi:hypothetical protein